MPRIKRLPLASHASNPFEEAIFGGSSELSELSSDLGGYRIPGDITPVQVEEEVAEVEDEENNVEIDQVEGYAQENIDEGTPDFDEDESMSSDFEDLWEEEELEEENSILFRPPDEKEEIEREIADLTKAVPRLANEYQLLDRLGTGTFSSVYKAIDKKYLEYDNGPWRANHPEDSSAYYQTAPHDPSRKFFVAIKRIYVTSMPDRIRNELAILEDVRGCRHVSQLITAFREADQVVAIMPYHRNIDFREYYQILSIEGIKKYMRSLFRGLRDIHARGIIHRDIKPANFLFDLNSGIGTICDLGLACRMTYDEETACNHTAPSYEYPHGQYKQKEDIATAQIKQAKASAKARCKWPADRVGYPEHDTRPQSKANRAGTRGFRAPEVLLKCASQSGAVDIWSAGTILLFFLTGKFPLFHCPNDTEAFVELAVLLGKNALDKAGILHNRVLITNIPSIEPNGKDLRTFVHTLNPSILRPRGATQEEFDAHTESLEHAIDLLKMTLDPEAVKRITARDALYHPFLFEEGKPGDDEFFPHPIGRGKCGKYHKLIKRQDIWGVTVEEQRIIMAPGNFTNASKGEFIPIGSKPCEMHQYTLEHDVPIEVDDD
ncbi:hypothetical protein M422DRAFT_62940 [Sphaerobolus stellatus SS14]|nr:hypothetical protein M422DRAFT_62940 [Sphaerobolus stellatus SS14]